MTQTGGIGTLSRIHRWLGKLQHRFVTPCNLVRLCRRSQELRSIINEALQEEPPWPSDLIERVENYILEKGNRELSVYEVATIDPLDHGHALGVIAEGIAQKDFHENAGKKRKRGATRGTLLLPAAFLPRSVDLRFTPENNLDFFPANERHYDLCVPDTQELAEAILDGIHKRKISWTFLANDGTYRLQAAIAYSHCLAEFGKLDHTNPPSEWSSGTNLSSSQQIETLKHLTNTSAVDSPERPS